MKDESSSKLKESSNQTINCNIPFDTAESSERKYNVLKESLKNRKMVSVEYRLSILKKLLELWDQNEADIQLSNKLDLGQSEFTSKFTTFYQVRNEIIYAIKNIHCWVKPRKCDTPLLFPLCNNYIKPEPFGLTLLFSAWNCNFLTLIIPLVQAIAAGNLVLAKPAATAPETQKVCMNILNDLPKDAVQCCAGKSDVREKLLSLRYDLIIFTGSAKIGKIIAEAAAKNLTPCILELGGQNPVIVEKSANLNTAAQNITFGRHTINGQACIAPEYVMVDKTIFKPFVEEIVKKYKEFYGEDTKNSPDLGKMVNGTYTKRLYDLIKEPGEGAKLECGGCDKCDLNSNFITPTIFSFNSLSDMGKSRLAEAELFGPVLYISPYDRIEEAIEYMQEREKPLASYLFTENKEIKEYVRDNTRAGVLVINDTVIHFAQPFVPFGGVGNSGMSAYHGKFGFDNMSHLKPVVDNSSIIMPIRYPPYSAQKKKLLLFALKNLPFGVKQTLKILFKIIVFFFILLYILKKLK